MFNNPLNLTANMTPQGNIGMSGGGGGGMGVDLTMLGQGRNFMSGMPQGGRPMGLTMDSVYGRKGQHQRKYKDFNTALFKTELCRSYTRSGRCTYGARCQFSHGKTDLRPVVRHRKYKTDKCRNFLNGYCPYGNRCCFLHSESPEQLSKLGVNVNGVKVTINDQAPDMTPIGGVKYSGVNPQCATGIRNELQNIKQIANMQGQNQMGIPQNMRGRMTGTNAMENDMANGMGRMGNNNNFKGMASPLSGANGPLNGNDMRSNRNFTAMMQMLASMDANNFDMSFVLAHHHQMMAQYWSQQVLGATSPGASNSGGGNMGQLPMNSDDNISSLMANLAHLQLRADAVGLGDITPDDLGGMGGFKAPGPGPRRNGNESSNSPQRNPTAPTPNGIKQVTVDIPTTQNTGNASNNAGEENRMTQDLSSNQVDAQKTSDGREDQNDMEDTAKEGEAGANGQESMRSSLGGANTVLGIAKEGGASVNHLFSGRFNATQGGDQDPTKDQTSTETGQADFNADGDSFNAASQDVVQSSIKMLGLES